MSSRGGAPLAEQRRVRVALRQARDARNLTQKEVAESLDWSTSKLIRIENGSVGISVTDLKALLLHYGITAKDEVERLVEGARASKNAAWWQNYRAEISMRFLTFLQLEASAIRIRQYQSLIVPGLLQVPGYAAELIQAASVDQKASLRGKEIRLKRQELITEQDVEAFFIIDESVLYRKVGDAAVMRDQLTRVRELAALENVTVQILPFVAGVHKAMKSSFEVLELSDGPDDYSLLIEMPYKDELYPDPSDETKEYVNFFFELEGIALPASETPRIIDARLSQMEKEE